MLSGSPPQFQNDIRPCKPNYHRDRKGQLTLSVPPFTPSILDSFSRGMTPPSPPPLRVRMGCVLHLPEAPSQQRRKHHKNKARTIQQWLRESKGVFTDQADGEVLLPTTAPTITTSRIPSLESLPLVFEFLGAIGRLLKRKPTDCGDPK